MLFLFGSAKVSIFNGGCVYTYVEREYGGVSLWKLKRYLAEEPTDNSTLILAEKRTQRKDPIDNFHKYKGGWNISNKHYWAVSFSHLCQR